MFIIDCAMLNNTICVTKDIGEFLINTHHVPLLSYKNEHYIFANTKALNDIIDNLSFEIRKENNND